MIERKLSQYTVVDEIARGGMGVVYRARDERLNREVALKVLPPELIENPDRRRRFEQEARAAAALEHPHIGVVYQIGEDEGVAFIAMELIQGRPLQEVLAAEPLPLASVLEWAVEMGEGLAYAHSKGIVHRDFKPSNVMLTALGHVKIIDFGLAKLLTTPFQSGSESVTAVRQGTRAGELVGTVGYMSPEQARARELDGRSDVFSFGIVFVEMLTGKPPFLGASAADIVSAILKEPPPRLPDDLASPSILSELQRIANKCLEKNPAERYQDMSDLVVDLRRARRLLDVSQAGFSLEPQAERRRTRSGVLVALAATLALSAGAFLYLTRNPRARPVVPPSQPAVAILGFKNLSGNAEMAWLSTALSEMLGTELSVGANLRVIPGEDVARMKIELSLTDSESFGGETLARVKQILGADYVVLGAYTSIGSGTGGRLRLDARLQDASAGETVAALAESGPQENLFEMVERAGAVLREKLGVRTLSDEEARTVQAAHSASPEANRFYAGGLEELRRYQALEARVLLEKAVEHDRSFALAHAALSQAWSALGFDAKAEASAKTALDLAAGLPRGDYLIVKGRYHETSGSWGEAVATYKLLESHHPDNIDHGLRLAEAETRAGQAGAALETIGTIRLRIAGGRDDPRVDLAEARAAESLADFPRELEAAKRVATTARQRQAWLLVAEARYLEGSAWVRSGKPEQARAALEEAQALFEQGGNRGKVAECINQQAILLKYAGKLDEAEALYRKALDIHGETGDRASRSYALNNLAFMLWQKGELKTAESLLVESLALAREVGSQLREAGTLDTLASIYLSQGRLADASRAEKEALAISEKLGERSMAAWTYHTLGLVAHASGELQRASEMYTKALAICGEIGYRHLSAYVLNDQGRLLLDQGEMAGADKKLSESHRLRRELGEKGTVVETDVNRALLLLERGEPQKAEALASVAAAEFGREGMQDLEALARALASRSGLARGDAIEARKQLGPAIERVRKSESPEVRIAVGLVEARLKAHSGDPSALSQIERLQTEGAERGLGRLELEARLALGEAEIALGRVQDGRRRLGALASDARAKGFVRIAKRADSQR